MLSFMAKIFATFGSYILKDTQLQRGMKKWSVSGATAEFELGAAKSGVTLGRAVALGVFSLAVKKNKSSVYVTVVLEDGEQIVVEGPVKDEKKARNFSAKVNQAARLEVA
ncbi:MAG: hypothetical protein JWR01_1108 [Subtercola sp.]|nr:hypothetical protein [Subtercola sp.]